MLTANQLRQVAAVSDARDIGNVEIDVILTYLLQLFSEKGVTEHVAFKGGTMLRKMVFGPRGRLSTDLDFTCCTDITVDDLMLMMLEAVDKPFHGIGSGFTSTPSRRATEARSLATWCITPCPWIFLCIAGWCRPALKKSLRSARRNCANDFQRGKINATARAGGNLSVRLLCSPASRGWVKLTW